MNKKAIVLLSGGLDSILAAKLMLEQGVDVLAVNFSAKLCMCGCKTTGESPAEAAAKMLDIPLKTIDMTGDFIEIIKNPRYGHGANMNPCIDCKIYMLRHAKDMMDEVGASFLVTGEVLGERPMSQRRDALNLIEKRADVKGILLRPLTAGNLDPTLPEKEGIVERDKLLNMKGLSDKARLVVGRCETENDILLSIAGPDDVLFELKDREGPISILRGEAGDSLINLAASMAVYHTKFRHEESVRVDYWKRSETRKKEASIKPAGKNEIEPLRI